MKNYTQSDDLDSNESPDHEIQSKKVFIAILVVCFIIGALLTVFIIHPIENIINHFKDIEDGKTRIRSIVSIVGFLFIASMVISVIRTYAPHISFGWALLLMCIYTPPWIMDSAWSLVRPKSERISEL